MVGRGQEREGSGGRGRRGGSSDDNVSLEITDGDDGFTAWVASHRGYFAMVQFLRANGAGRGDLMHEIDSL